MTQLSLIRSRRAAFLGILEERRRGERRDERGGRRDERGEERGEKREEKERGEFN